MMIGIPVEFGMNNYYLFINNQAIRLKLLKLYKKYRGEFHSINLIEAQPNIGKPKETQAEMPGSLAWVSDLINGIPDLIGCLH